MASHLVRASSLAAQYVLLVQNLELLFEPRGKAGKHGCSTTEHDVAPKLRPGVHWGTLNAVEHLQPQMSRCFAIIANARARRKELTS